jgi:hypothetical protein
MAVAVGVCIIPGWLVNDEKRLKRLDDKELEGS